MQDNPFLYITPNKRDFEDMKGRLMLNNFKNTFLRAYQKYNSAVEKWQEKVSE